MAAEISSGKFKKHIGSEGTQYTGPEGEDLAAFLELHCPDDNVRYCHFGADEKKWVQKSWLILTKNENNNKNPYQTYGNDYITLSALGEKKLAEGKGCELVYTVSLRCKGSFHRGNDSKSGRNCQKRCIGGKDCKLYF